MTTLPPTLAAYFAAFNAGDWQTCASLFTVDGSLLPPFEKPVPGQEAIYRYLAREAVGMRAEPQVIHELESPAPLRGVEVRGRAHTPLFSVHVAWLAVLDPEDRIIRLQVSLLASLEELLPLQGMVRRGMEVAT